MNCQNTENFHASENAPYDITMITVYHYAFV